MPIGIGHRPGLGGVVVQIERAHVVRGDFRASASPSEAPRSAGVRTDTLADLVTFSDSRRPSRIVAGKNNEADEDPLAREDPVVTVPGGRTGG
jgi:hypothetical protein